MLYVVEMPPAPVYIPSEMLSRSCRSVNDEGDNEVKLGDMHRSSGFYLMAEVNSGKPQLRDRLKAVR